MGYIKEPKGVDFLIAPSVLTPADTEAISAAITNYRKTIITDKTQNTVLKHRSKVLINEGSSVK